MFWLSAEAPSAVFGPSSLSPLPLKSAACSVVRHGACADSRVAAYDIEKECLMTNRGIVVAGGVSEQGRNANTGVVISGRVGLER